MQRHPNCHSIRGRFFVCIGIFFFAQFSWRCVSCTVNHKWGTDREVSPGQYIHLRPIWLRRIQPRYSVYNIFLPNSVVWSSKLDGLWCQYVTRQNLPRGGRVVEDWDLIASSLQGKVQTNELCILSVKNAESNKKYKFLHSAFFFYTYVSFFSLSLP